jgi:hypothetical protein
VTLLHALLVYTKAEITVFLSEFPTRVIGKDIGRFLYFFVSFIFFFYSSYSFSCYCFKFDFLRHYQSTVRSSRKCKMLFSAVYQLLDIVSQLHLQAVNINLFYAGLLAMQ